MSDTEVCVVGAGPAGALVANRLASAGHDVTILEAGPRFEERDTERMEQALRPGLSDLGVWGMGGPRDAFSTTGRFYPLNSTRVKGVGGSTNHWQGMVYRLHEADFAGENNGPAWPISYDDLRPYYLAAERAIGVAGDSENPYAPPREEPHPMGAFPPSYSDSLFAEGCQQVGVTTHSVGNARNSEAYDDRAACVGYGTCKPVCPSGARYDATHTIAAAEERGVEVIANAPVQRLDTDASGEQVTRAVYVREGSERELTADRFVLAAGGIEIPRLLLLSADDSHPDGLANGSGAVGRYFHEHVFAGTGGRIDEPTRQNHVGFITSESHQFYDEPGAGTETIPDSDEPLAPFKLEFLNYGGPSGTGQAIVRRALSSDSWGDDLLAELREGYGNQLAMGGLVGQPPRAENRIRLDEGTTDDHGNPVPEIQWTLDETTKRTIRRATEIQRHIFEAVGARIEWQTTPKTTGPAAHHMGTTRMSSDPESGVVRPDCRTHEVSNLWVASSSVFPNGGALNPTLTIAALALLCADSVAESF
ncbi:GMC oxidoreductase [Halosegnis longus]|uniref:GMC oxidoreductase n=1 Tax=Halosegnis longus TaxID=2216012 RepID=UPI00096A9966|nr:GMC oxidoreductase [Salella cibi]